MPLWHGTALYVLAGTTDTPETKTNEEAVRSLLVITGSPPINPNYEAFKRKVNEYDNLPPFSFPDPFNTLRQVGRGSQLYELSDNQVNVTRCYMPNTDGGQYSIDAFFEVHIRICQPENNDVHRGEAEVNSTFEGWLILMLTEEACTNCFVIWHCLYFPRFISSLFILINYSSQMFRVHLKRLFNNCFSGFWNPYETHSRTVFFKLLFSQNKQILNSKHWPI